MATGLLAEGAVHPEGASRGRCGAGVTRGGLYPGAADRNDHGGGERHRLAHSHTGHRGHRQRSDRATLSRDDPAHRGDGAARDLDALHPLRGRRRSGNSGAGHAAQVHSHDRGVISGGAPRPARPVGRRRIGSGHKNRPRLASASPQSFYFSHSRLTSSGSSKTSRCASSVRSWSRSSRSSS